MHHPPSSTAAARCRPLWLLVLGLGLLPAAASEPLSQPPPGTGWSTHSFAGNGTPLVLNNPFGIVRGPDGALYVCEYDGNRILRLDEQGHPSPFAGSGRRGAGGDGGPASDAEFDQPHELRFDRDGNLLVADMRNHRIRRIDARTRRVSTLAGTGEPGFSGDGGPARMARLRQPHSIQFSPEGDLFICDIGNHRIRRVSGTDGTISTFAGTGTPGPTPDGAPLSGTPLNGPRSLDFGPDGQLWLALREGNQVFRIDPRSRTFHHVAGTGRKGTTGDGGPARAATLSGPKGIAVGPDGAVYLADTEGHSIRRIDPRSGFLERVAGTGERGDGPDGDGGTCRLARPHGIAVEPDGTLWVGDSENHRVRRITRAPR